MANFDGEVPTRDLLNIANLKKLTGEDYIWANEKYKIPHSFLYTGKLIFALNSLPKIKLNDQEVDSFFSRVLIINYLKSHIDDQNTNLDNELSEEISGIFNWAMEGLERLKNNNFKFSITQNLEQKQRLYTLESDPLKVFSDEKIMPGDCKYKSEELYEIFLKFCSTNSIDPSMNIKNLRSFQIQLTNILKVRVDLNFESKKIGHQNMTYYTGFCVKDSENNDKKDENPLDSYNGNKGHNNFDPNSLPEGPFKESLKEELELKEIEKNRDNPDIIYRKSQDLAIDIAFIDTFQYSGFNYYAIDKSKNNTNGKAWTKYMLKSMEISKKDFETMRSAMRGGKK